MEGICLRSTNEIFPKTPDSDFYLTATMDFDFDEDSNGFFSIRDFFIFKHF